MKKLGLVLLLAVLTIGFNGCINVKEVITFKKNGSGSYSLTYDLGGAMSFIKNMDLGKMLGEEGDSEDGASDIIGQLPKMMDTTVYAKNMMQAAGSWEEMERKDFWEGVKIRTVMNDAKGLMETTMSFDFEDASDIKYFQNHVGQLTEGGDSPMSGITGMLGGMGGSSNFSFKKKDFKRATTGGDMNKPQLTDEMEQQLQMVKMFLADAKYTTVYHFPRKVKSTTIKNAVISDDKKTITQEVNLLKLMDESKAMDGEVKLKGWLW